MKLRRWGWGFEKVIVKVKGMEMERWVVGMNRLAWAKKRVGTKMKM